MDYRQWLFLAIAIPNAVWFAKRMTKPSKPLSHEDEERKISLANVTAHLDDWANSPGLKPPK